MINIINLILLIILLAVLIYPKIREIRRDLYFNQDYHKMKYKIKTCSMVFYCNLTFRYDVKKEYFSAFLKNIKNKEELKKLVEIELSKKQIKDTIFRYNISKISEVWCEDIGNIIERPTSSYDVMQWLHTEACYYLRGAK